jgi:hypothetical protein
MSKFGSIYLPTLFILTFRSHDESSRKFRITNGCCFNNIESNSWNNRLSRTSFFNSAFGIISTNTIIFILYWITVLIILITNLLSFLVFIFSKQLPLKLLSTREISILINWNNPVLTLRLLRLLISSVFTKERFRFHLYQMKSFSQINRFFLSVKKFEIDFISYKSG